MTKTTTNVTKEIAALDRMTVGQLRQRYSEVFGEPARSGNRQWLLRRVAWRIQALAEGDLATRAIERCRERARELAVPPENSIRRGDLHCTKGHLDTDGQQGGEPGLALRGMVG